MTKEKKIGIRYFLNQRLKPNKVFGADQYPVYAQITYDRKTLQCLTPIGYLSEQEFKQYIENDSNSDFQAVLDNFDQLVRKAIRAEAKVKGDKFAFKGFTNRLEIYEMPLMEVLGKRVKHALIKSLQKELSEEQLTNLKSPLFHFWNVLELVFDSYSEEFKKVFDKDLRIILTSFVYVSGYYDIVDSNLQSLDKPLKVIDWFGSDLPTKFKDFLFDHSPIDTDKKKEALGFFKNESKKSVVLSSLYMLNVSQKDIPLIIKSIESLILES